MRDYLIAVATVQMKTKRGAYSKLLRRMWQQTNACAAALPEEEGEMVRNAVACYFGTKLFAVRADCEPNKEAEERYREHLSEANQKYLVNYLPLTGDTRKAVDGILAEIDAFFATVR